MKKVLRLRNWLRNKIKFPQFADALKFENQNLSASTNCGNLLSVKK
jgi:hypothetical protein